MQAKQVRLGLVSIGLTGNELRTLRQILNEVFNGIGFANLYVREPVEIGSGERIRRVLSSDTDLLERRPDIHDVLMSSDELRDLLSLCIAVREAIGDEELHTRVGLNPGEYAALVDQLRRVVELQG